MEREIIETLTLWKNKTSRKPLVLTGVRQCGKTYICKEFGKRYFDDTAYFNFEGNAGLSSIFEFDYNVNRIIDELGNIIRGKEIIPGKTLLIFDEIQECPKAITSLKYFCENMPDLHVICAGSLLGVSVKRESVSFPVGKVERLQMYPLSFEEFVKADGGESILTGAKNYDKFQDLPELYTAQLEKYLKYYYIVGGMPEAVRIWTETHNFDQVDEILENILLDYNSDFAKHAPLKDIPKLGWIWDSIPKQLAKENNKFVFSHVKAGKRAAELEDALMWLIDAGLIHKLELVTNPEIPLSFQADAMYFKVYMSDIGLLRKKSGISPKTILEDTATYKNFKGAFTENYVLTQLVILGFKPYFWRSGNTAELDFVFESQEKIIPMEAKATIHTRAKRYLQYCKKYQPEIGIRMSLKNVGENTVENTSTVSLPLYMIGRIKDYV